MITIPFSLHAPWDWLKPARFPMVAIYVPVFGGDGVWPLLAANFFMSGMEQSAFTNTPVAHIESVTGPRYAVQHLARVSTFSGHIYVAPPNRAPIQLERLCTFSAGGLFAADEMAVLDNLHLGYTTIREVSRSWLLSQIRAQ